MAGVIPLIVIFVLGIALMLPSIADIGKEINEVTYEQSSQNDIMTEIYENNKRSLFWVGVLLILGDIGLILLQASRGNWL